MNLFAYHLVEQLITDYTEQNPKASFDDVKGRVHQHFNIHTSQADDMINVLIRRGMRRAG